MAETKKTKKGFATRFFESRAPRRDDFTLGIRNIYVFFSRQGLLFLLLLIITFITGVNYGNNLVLGLFFYLLSIWLVAAVLTFLQLSRLQIQLQSVSLAPAGGLAWVTFSLKNHQGRAVRQLELAFWETADVAVLSASEREIYKKSRQLRVSSVEKEVTLSLPVIAERRGVLVLPKLVLKSRYPLGVASAWSYGFFLREGFVYPTPKAFDSQTTARTEGRDEVNSPRYQVGQDDFDKLDSYISGESLARVSWAHVARGVGMLTKHFADPVGGQTVLSYHDMPSARHEDKLSELAYAVLKQDATPFVLVLPSGAGAVGSGEEFIQASLLRLAKEP